MAKVIPDEWVTVISGGEDTKNWFQDKFDTHVPIVIEGYGKVRIKYFACTRSGRED